jgi:hypothetical protein
MKTESKEGIKAHLDRALNTQSSTVCILRKGMPEKGHIHSENPIIYRKIEFEPHGYMDGSYVGVIFYPHGKSQGLINFSVDSFESVICLEEA